jgi:hypothetical protein
MSGRTPNVNASVEEKQKQSRTNAAVIQGVRLNSSLQWKIHRQGKDSFTPSALWFLDKKIMLKYFFPMYCFFEYAIIPTINEEVDVGAAEKVRQGEEEKVG